MSNKQWQCPACGAWLDDCWNVHTHRDRLPMPALDEMIQSQRLDELGIRADDPLRTTPVGKAWGYFRTGKEPMRGKPI